MTHEAKSIATTASQNNMLPAKPVSPLASKTTKSSAVWYLGGNHAARLLTSVEGDLDHNVLSKLAAVPTVVGELALSVESLVSDDLTVGGFENDVLAKIAANTLNARKRASAASPAKPASPVVKKAPVTTAPVIAKAPPAPLPAVAKATKEQPAEASMPKVVSTGSVPNPLLDNYDPVPNPLARITPPASPTPAGEQQTSNKRKESPTLSLDANPAKRAALQAR